MSVSYRVVRHSPTSKNCKVLDQGCADSRRSILDNPPRIIVSSAKSAAANIYEVQIWCQSGWVCLTQLLPWTAVQTHTSMEVCFTTADVPLAGDDCKCFTADDIPVTGMDVSIPLRIAPAVTYI